MKHALTFIAAAAILFAQYRLSRLKHWQFGGILPLCTVLFAVWCFCFRNPPLDISLDQLPFIVILVILLSEWSEGRDKLKKDRKKELEKMEAWDIDTKKHKKP